MRIKQLHVSRYGPMAPFENDELGNFALVHGANERGKTLLIDALIRLLFKKELRKTVRRHFGVGNRNMNRVLENPEGYVVLQTGSKEHKLEANQTLNDVLQVAITPDDFRNVFVVRDGDLTLRDEDKYYSRVSEKLTGLRSSEIDRLMRALQKRGKLRSATPDSDLANSLEQGKIADKVKDAESLIREIRALRETLLAEKFDELESEQITIHDRLRVLGREAELQRVAGDRKKFRKARRALGDLKRMKKTLASLESLDSEQLKRWQKLISRRESTETDIAEEKKEAEKTERAIRSAKKALNAQEAKTREFEEKLNRIDAELKPSVDEYQYERAEFRRLEPQTGTYRKGLFATAGITALALIGYLVHPSIVIAVIGAAALAVWFGLGFKQLKLRSAEGRLRAKMEKLSANSKRCGIELESVDEVISTIADLERELSSQQQETQSLKGDLQNLVKEKRRIENRIEVKSELMADLDAEILELRTDTQMATVGDYQAAIERRTKLAAAADAKVMILQDLMPTKLVGDSALDDWDRRIAVQLQATDGHEQVEFNAEALKRTTAEIAALEERKKEIHSALLQGSRKLHSVEVKAKELAVLDSSPPCRSTQELDYIGSLIVQFCDRVRRDQRIAQQAIEICRLVDAEERARVSDLFGPDSPVSEHVATITDGRYREVHYEADKNYVYLVDAAGDRIPAVNLSGGAFDQLYFAIRITIATRLLADEKGFLILDDPFVKADDERLDRMMEMLRRLAEGGWQILYFSAKDEVKQSLAKDIVAGSVRLVTLEAPRDTALLAERDNNELPPTQIDPVAGEGDPRDLGDTDDAERVRGTGEIGLPG